MDADGLDDPTWEILNLVREVRRRVRAGNAERIVQRLAREPAWVKALPKEEAQLARSLVKATRDLARRTVKSDALALGRAEAAATARRR